MFTNNLEPKKLKLACGRLITVYGWFITSEFAEYYVTQLPNKEGVGKAYVVDDTMQERPFSINAIYRHITHHVNADDIVIEDESKLGYIAPPESSEWVSVSL